MAGAIPGRTRGQLSDPLVLVAAGALVALGLLNLITLDMPARAERQLAAAVAGFIVLIVLSRLSAPRFVRLGWAGYVTTIAALMVLWAIGTPVNGAKRWLDIGPVTIQPSEFAKVFLILALASILAPGYTRGRLAACLGVAAVPIGLVALQPDLSTAVVMAALTAFMLILARVPMLSLVALFGAALVALPIAGLALRPYQVGRLEAFLEGQRDASGSGWSMLQAEIAIGTGGWFGQSRDPLYDLRAQYLPERQHDLAFASLIQGWGLVAGLAVAGCVLILVWRASAASRTAFTPMLALSAAGVGAMFGTQVVISIAGNLGLLPHTGLPIPLFSYGGTATVTALAALGLIFAARRDAVTVWPLWAPPPDQRRHPRWVRLGALGLVVSLSGLAWSAWQLQAGRHDELQATSDEQMTRCVRLPAERGIITDRHGEPLVHNVDAHNVRVIPGLFDERSATTISELAALTGQSTAAMATVIGQRGGEFAKTVATVPPAVAARIAEADLPGVLVTHAERREYPYGELLGPILGFVGVGTGEDLDRWPDLSLGAMVGRAGLEQQYDALLRGNDGQQCMYVDPRGRPAAVAERTDPEPGTDLALHLDLTLQELAFAELQSAISDSGGDLGGAVVMDARTGAVLALASVPSFDNNVYGPPVDGSELGALAASPGLPMLNHVTQVAAPPGSTFKLVIAAANAAESFGSLAPAHVIPTGASYTFGGHTFRNWRPMPPQNLSAAIAWSNNVYFYELARRLGVEQIATTADQLGVGRPTGIDLPTESGGFLGTPESVAARGGHWYGGTTILLGIGQGPLTTTPLQAARWTAGIATGAVVTPQLAASFGDDEPTAVDGPDPEPLPFADQLGPGRDGMRAAVTGGTAGGLRDLPVSSGGKTGSAEDAQAPNGQPNSWFTAFAPFENPEVAVAVFVRGGGMGSTTSGPVAKELLHHYATAISE
jgi:penicillin-binding protein 2